MSFDASSRVSRQSGYGEWAFVVKTGSGAILFSQHGPAVSHPLCNLYAEWEGLVAGLDWIGKGHVSGCRGLSITGDERTVISQLHGTRRCNDTVCIGWRDLALGQLEVIGLPWNAVKVSREQNIDADLLAGGNW